MGDGTVLVRLGALGDVVLLGAVTGALAGPVTVVTRARYEPVASRLRGVTRVVTPEAAGGLQGRWIDLQRNLRSIRLAPWARRVRKHSVRRRLQRWGWAPRPDVPTAYAEACGVSVQPRPWLDLPTQPRRTLLLVPGAAWATKRAPVGLLAAAGRAWGGPVVVAGGPGEDALVAAVCGLVPDARPLVERGFDETLRVLGGTSVAVGGDSGLLHLAGAAGAQLVTLFGPTSPLDGFAVHPGEVVQRSLPCRPCTLHGAERCWRGDHACLDLDERQVVAAVMRCAG